MQKEKSLYSSLNKLKKQDRLYVGFCWIAQNDNEEIIRKVTELKVQNHSDRIPTLKKVEDHGIKPPTLFRMNEVTWVF